MSSESLKNNILDKNLCTSCGLCISVCPTGTLKLSDSKVPVPKFKTLNAESKNKCTNCGLCEKVCPGYDTGTGKSEENIFGRRRNKFERWTGIYYDSCKIAAADSNLLKHATSGGAATVLSITALEEGIVDAVIVVGRDKDKPWVPKAVFADTPEKIVECAQTSYCITPTLHLLKDCRYKKVGIIGLPCQMQAVRKLMSIKGSRYVENIKSKISLMIELACSSNTKLEGTEHIITDHMGLSLNDVAELKYREGEYPGNFMVKTKSGKQFTYPFYKSVEQFRNFKTYRCSACPDWWSGLADISISDGNPNVYAMSRDGKNSLRYSTVVIRTPAGKKLVHTACKKGYVSCAKYSFENNLGLERKRQRYRFYQKNQKQLIPIASGEDCNYDEILTDEEVLTSGVNAKE